MTDGANDRQGLGISCNMESDIGVVTENVGLQFHGPCMIHVHQLYRETVNTNRQKRGTLQQLQRRSIYASHCFLIMIMPN